MWLQTMWFIAKTPPQATVVLDEPDVYMHPDLQRKLYRLIKARFAQSIIATHSVEIMAEADPSEILVINNKKARSEYANTEPAVQVLVDQLGGIHNVHLARLWNARKVILLEGKDLAFLKTLHAKLYPNAETPLDAIPNLSIGGWGGWAHAIGSNMALKNAVGDRITTYCIFDRDYHILIGKAILAPNAHAESTETAYNTLARTEHNLRNTVKSTAAKARRLQERLNSEDHKTTLPKDVKEFQDTTHRLEELRDDLRADIARLSRASTRTLNAFDHERAAITDPITRHAMTSLRTQTRQQTTDRLNQARQALNLLTRVLVQGNDVAHAATCVQLAEQLNTHGQTLRLRIGFSQANTAPHQCGRRTCGTTKYAQHSKPSDSAS
jgi:hypothetical protein